MPVNCSFIRLVVTASLILTACEQSPPSETPGPVRKPNDTVATPQNPLDSRYLTPFETPPFHEIHPEHFLPALDEAISAATEASKSIASAPSKATFDNTIAALERASDDVNRIARTFYGLAAVSPDPQLHSMAEPVAARLAAFRNAVLQHKPLFDRVATVHDQLQSRDLTPEQRRLTERTHRQFLRSGARLPTEDQARLRRIEEELAELIERFERQRRQATHDHEFIVENPELLETLPNALVQLAQRSARDRGHTKGWVFTLHAHSLYPFLRHYPERSDRRQIYQAWLERFNAESQNSRLAELSRRIAEKRARRAELLGYSSHIDYELDGSMTSDRRMLRSLLDRLAEAARKRARDELLELRQLARADGIEAPLEPWDRWYYAERLRERELSFREADLRSWFVYDNVREGAFSVANRLWGLSFHPRSNLPVWHLDTEAFEVEDERGNHLGVLYVDALHRPGKQAGAWTSTYRPQHYDDNERVGPVAAIVGNFTPAPPGLPSLLTPDEARMLFHEMGHALHVLLSDVRHASLAGTSVPADFVEFPALLFEQWALAPEILRGYAYHHETGSVIGDDVVEALRASERLTSGIEMLEFLAAIELDLMLHDTDSGSVPDLAAAEAAVRERLGLPEVLSHRHYAGGVADLFAERQRSGDFQTLVARMLAHDAFAAFKSGSLIDRNLAERLRQEILARGNARPPAESWQAFRGRSPDPAYLLDVIESGAGG
ncbi:MAG: M3 family metallopeptidase [Pseudomonadota bacterium]|nr:MAG: M3 family metallopeptidase [Pseudomonadota bacterium]